MEEEEEEEEEERLSLSIGLRMFQSCDHWEALQLPLSCSSFFLSLSLYSGLFIFRFLFTVGRINELRQSESKLSI